MADKLIKAFIIIAMFVFNYLLCIVLHEAGHLCMGKATGYKMVSFRIGPAKLYKKNGKLTLMRETVPGTLGQSLSPSSLRVIYAYDRFVIKDEEKAEAEYEAAMEHLKKAPVGDVKMETKLLEAAGGCSEMMITPQPLKACSVFLSFAYHTVSPISITAA